MRAVSYAAVSGGPLVPLDPPPSDGVVSLRPWADDDVAVLVECCNEAEIARWLDQVPQPYTESDARAHLRSVGDAFAVADAETGAVLGSVGVRWNDDHDIGEVGYWTRAEARGRGVTTRALTLVSRWAFGLDGVARLQLRADEQNTASRRVAEKAGYQLEGILRSAHWSPRQERRCNWAMYSQLPGELD
jgi:RimJ/RimL family protein N-acetyltransferase